MHNDDWGVVECPKDDQDAHLEHVDGCALHDDPCNGPQVTAKISASWISLAPPQILFVKRPDDEKRAKYTLDEVKRERDIAEALQGA